ncbi:DEAD/DEAH box helicase [Rhodococcus sp. G-MC3]|uniref:DEAD/DEAH box helicase n=1 Tax=Rhodococcus sp. G-MC3 TaxID=3046209 RepID=UPI0024B8F750|nr:DEAD/DEAH box helicase [Rhodococcus sp. G-MC3]MDJ0394114.1 DEAD/DEAH box helicase [Rhodococcus sp. G-MC3]
MPGPTLSFADLGLRPVVVHALRKIGIETPFPIQRDAIPDALAGTHILGRAPTGSGKTYAFGLPMLHRLSGSASPRGRPRGLILVPTRELALQIEQALEEPALASGIRIVSVVGGVPVKRQVDRLLRGVDIVVATPGRLEDIVDSGALSLDAVTITVIDEADRLADLGFLPQVQALLDRTPPRGQRMLFSATLDGDVDSLSHRYLTSPAVHSTEQPLGDSAVAQHLFLRVSNETKSAVATSIAARDGRTIMFLRTKHAVDRFTDSLHAVGVAAVALHGDKSQANRTRSLAAFADGSVPVLVATDVAARGIHVDGVSLVVHVDPPADAKDYTHRAGRTARAGNAGTVVTLVTEKEQPQVSTLAALAGVDPRFVDVTPSSRFLVENTGARRPPGHPLTEPTGVIRETPKRIKGKDGRPPKTYGSSSGRTRRTGRR